MQTKIRYGVAAVHNKRSITYKVCWIHENEPNGVPEITVQAEKYLDYTSALTIALRCNSYENDQ